MRGLKRYPELMGSRVPWASKVPGHWRTVRAKWLFTKMDRPVRPGDEVVTCFRDGTVTLRKNRRELGYTESLKEIGYQGIRRGDLVIHAMDAFAGACGVSDSDGKSTPVYSVCAPRDGTANSRYYAFCVREMARNQWILALSRGVRERSTDFRFAAFGDLLVPVPPGLEQRAIVQFLDHADRHIQRYIRAKERLIELLEEQKQAIIHRAVTGQIDVRTGEPYPAYKNSGVDWLGEVPEHWNTKRLKWVVRLQRGYDLPATERRHGPYPVVSSGGVIGTHSEYRCNGPGLVMGRYGSTEALSFVEEAFWPHNTSLFVTDFQGNRHKWCYYLLKAIAKAEHAGKSAVPGLNRNHLFQIVVGVPSVDEQLAMMKALDWAMRTLDNAMVAVAQQIQLVREYRNRLIADVVTGKLDVREAAADLPEAEPVTTANRPGTNHTESHSDATEHDMAKEAIT